jgi:hypothetical protein
MDLWPAERRVLPPAGWHNDDEPINREPDCAFRAQDNIGWDQFSEAILQKRGESQFAHTSIESAPDLVIPSRRINGCEK